jgi:glycolate oxidase FAD binding subunit
VGFVSQTFSPATPDQVRDAIRAALDAETPLDVRSRGTKARLGRPVTAAATLDLSGLAGVQLYEPEELVISLAPGTPRAEVELLLAEHNQMLAFEPPDWGPLLGCPPDADSIGGAIGINAAGPRRLKAGAARDFVLGVKGVSGFGEAFKSGGRVMKNVSGYDLGKLLTGAFGTLAALTEITLKVLPRPETETTLLAPGLDVDAATAALRRAASHAAEASGFAFLPGPVAARCPVDPVVRPGGSATLVRLEGAAASLAARADSLAAALGGTPITRLDADESRAVWRAVRDVAPLGPPADLPLWRLSVPPADAPTVLARNPSAFACLDWVGGLIWLASATTPQIERGAAMLARADDDARARLPFLIAPGDALAGVIGRVKSSFDPKKILNPGRMYEGV